MDGASSVAQSVQSVGALLQEIGKEQVEMQEKLVKFNVETSLPSVAGKGEAVDILA